MADDIQDILQRLRNVKKTSTGWSSKCPAHEDGANSLSVSTGSGGKLLLHCFTGCKFEDILAAIGPLESRAEIERTHPYVDEAGKLIFEVVRKVPKGFSQRRPDGSGGWLWNLKDTRRVLYRLPEVLAADGVVYVVEGEKDADNLVKLGLVATTNSGGAGKWRQEYADALRGKVVCLVPDNDDTGRQHMRAAALSLQGKASVVKVLELPGIPDKGDVTDWLAAGGTVQQLEELVRGAPLFDADSLRPETEVDEEQMNSQPPHNPDVERAVLGSVLLDPIQLSHCRQAGTTPDWFHVAANRYTFSCMLELEDSGESIDEITVGNLLKSRGQLAQVGGQTFVSRLSTGLNSAPNISGYLEILRRYHKARAGIRFAAKMAEQLKDGESDPDEVMESAVGWLDSQRTESRSIRRPMSIDEMYEDQALRFQLFHKGISDALPTGFPEIDEKLLGGGFLPSLLYYLAGKPSMGKTTLAIDFTCNIADLGFRCLVVSRETPKEMLLDRMVAAKAGVDRFKISSGMTKTNYELAMETLQVMRLIPIVFDDYSSSIAELDRVLAWYEREGKRIDFLMADYLQLMTGEGDNKVQQVSDVSKGFKGLLTKYRIPGLVVSNLNRASGTGEPEIHHLRESGQLEFDADAIFFVDGDETKEDLDFLKKKFLCKKQRDGPHFNRELFMNTRLVTFRRPDMLGLTVTEDGVKPRRLGTDEEELAKQKAGGKVVKKGPKGQEDSFEF